MEISTTRVLLSTMGLSEVELFNGEPSSCALREAEALRRAGCGLTGLWWPV